MLLLTLNLTITLNRTLTPTGAVAQGKESAHAGLLLALGLQGHLRVLSNPDRVDYLSQKHDPTTIATLLGSAASYLGTADSMISRTL